MRPLNIHDYKRIVILTGAGISAASGLPTYRGAGGLWREEDARIADATYLPGSLPDVWKLFGPLRVRVSQAQPNGAHDALAALQRRAAPGQCITLVTQNVDDLHERARSRDAVKLHGSLHRTRCMNTMCELTPFDDAEAHVEAVPVCPLCGDLLRPDIVLFNEPLPLDAAWTVKRALRECDLFLAVGTSGTVSPASEFVCGASYVGARTVLINLDAMSPRNSYFEEEYLGRAEELLPALLK
jgi:NAD-dependent deacetylase